MDRGRLDQRIGVAEVVVGDDDLGGVDPFGGDAVGAQDGRQQRGRKPLAGAADHIQAARGELAQHVYATTQPLESGQPRIKQPPERRPLDAVADELARYHLMLGHQVLARLAIGLAIPGRGSLGCIDQRIGYATHGRRNDDDLGILLSSSGYDLGYLIKGFGGADGGATELKYAHKSLLERKDCTRLPQRV